MRETHAKMLLERKAARLRESSGNPHLRSKLETANQRLTISQVLGNALIRPTKLLIRSPILLVISIYVALVFGTMYLLFTTFTDVFEGQYGFITTTSGLSFLGLGIALIVAMVTFRSLSDPIQQWRMRAEGVQTPKPEYRLVTMIFFSPFVSFGLFLYGWTAYYKVFWIVPIIGTSLIGFGAFFVLVSPTPLLRLKLSPVSAKFASLNYLSRCLRNYTLWISSVHRLQPRHWVQITYYGLYLAPSYRWLGQLCIHRLGMAGVIRCLGF